jgi:hypothetical protein
MCIRETIQEMDSPQSSMTIDRLLQYSGFQVDGISMMTSIGGQQEMVIEHDGTERIQAINDNDKPVIDHNMEGNKSPEEQRPAIAAITATKIYVRALLSAYFIAYMYLLAERAAD